MTVSESRDLCSWLHAAETRAGCGEKRIVCVDKRAHRLVPFDE